jgi:hypothetical protein
MLDVESGRNWSGFVNGGLSFSELLTTCGYTLYERGVLGPFTSEDLTGISVLSHSRGYSR